MAVQDGKTLRLKLLIDKNAKKVLFAEAEKDFVDFLFHIMTLPVGTVIRLLKNDGMVGCIGNLYGSIERIGDAYMVSADNKECLLKPKSPCGGPSFLLQCSDSSSASKTYYKCHSNSCMNIADNPHTKCPNHGETVTRQVNILEAKPSSTIPTSGYVKEVVMYTVMDDLKVTPLSSISTIASLSQFRVKDVGALQEKVVAVGIKEALAILKTSFYSENVLTDVFLGNPYALSCHDISLTED